jgi:hypothetical protein
MTTPARRPERSDLPQAAITSAWPSSSTSYTAVEFNGTGRAERLTAFAICGRQPTGHRIKSVTSSGTGPAGFNIGVVCLGAKTLLSGGIRVTNPAPDVTFGYAICAA